RLQEGRRPQPGRGDGVGLRARSRSHRIGRSPVVARRRLQPSGRTASTIACGALHSLRRSVECGEEAVASHILLDTPIAPEHCADALVTPYPGETTSHPSARNVSRTEPIPFTASTV